MNEYIIDILKYFAKFPEQSALQYLFKNKKSQISGYADLQTYVSEMTEHSLIPSIEGFVFGVTDANVVDRLRTIKQKYMYVEYGQVITSANQYSVKDTQMFLAVNVAYRDSSRTVDSIEESLLMEELFKDITDIEAQMIKDDEDACPFAKNIVFPSEKIPIASADFFNSIGWTMIFHRKLNLHD